MASFFKNKIVISCAAVTVAAVLILAIPSEKNFLAQGIKSVFSPVFSLTSNGVHSFSELKDIFLEMKGYKQENEKLVREISRLKQEQKSIGEYKEENERLNNLLSLKNDMDSSYKTIAARIISFEPNNWYDTIMINKGTNQGINVGDCVICDKGVVGKITNVGKNWANVNSIINEKNAIGVRITRTGDIGVVEGDPKLLENKFCKMSFIDKGKSMMVGDILETTGSGGIYPEGILVGTIKEIKSDNAGVNQYALVEPAVDFSDLYEVLVLSEAGAQ